MVIQNADVVLMVGNSRYHWATYQGDRLVRCWHTTHDARPATLPERFYFASVVPAQTRWIQQQFPHAVQITLADIPLKRLYATFGIDRALALWGAGQKYRFPCLVIDGGTALTFSAVDGDRQLVGGAILPGLRLQCQSLVQGTAALPHIDLPEQLPPRWAQDTQGAIASGIVHSVLAGIQSFIEAWRRDFPDGVILFTGGDGAWLAPHFPDTVYDPDVIFVGLQQAAIAQLP